MLAIFTHLLCYFKQLLCYAHMSFLTCKNYILFSIIKFQMPDKNDLFMKAMLP